MARFYKTPYVQNIPDYGYELPFNEILAGLDQKQKKFDEAAEIPDLIDDQLLKIQALFPEDKEYLQNYRTSLYDEIDNLSTSVNGDYSKIQPQLKNIARKVNRDMTQGPLANIMNWTEQGKKYLEAKNKLGAEGKYHERFTEELAGGKEFNAKMNKQYDPNAELSPYSFTFAHAKAPEEEITHNLFSDIEADATATGSFNKETGWSTDESTKGIYMQKIYKTAALNLGALPPDFQRELNFRVSNASEEELIANAGQFFGKYYGNTEEGKKLAQQKFNESIEAAKAGDFRSLEQAYKAEYVGRQGERFGYEDISKSNDFNATWGIHLDDNKEPPSTDYTTGYGTSSGNNVLSANSIDPIIGTVTFDANGQVDKTNGTVKWTLSENDAIKSETGKNYTDLITFTLPDGSKKEITIDELFVLTDTDVKTSNSNDPFTGVDFNSLVNKAANKYKDYLTSEEYVETVSKKLQDSQIELSGDPGTEYDLTPLTQKEFYDLTTDANNNLKQNTQFQSTFKSIGNWAEQQSDRMLTAANLENTNITVGGKTFKGVLATAEELGYDVENFVKVLSDAKISEMGYDGTYIVKIAKGNKFYEVKIPMETELKKHFAPIQQIYNAMRSREPITSLNIPLFGNKNMQVNVKTAINKNTRSYDYGFTVIDPDTKTEQEFDLKYVLDMYTQNFYKYINTKK